jgi:hypothetical protein
LVVQTGAKAVIADYDVGWLTISPQEDTLMAKKQTSTGKTTAKASKAAAADAAKSYRLRYCAVPPVPHPPLGADVNPNRARLIMKLRTKWVNGTVLHYYFFNKETDGANVVLPDGTTQWQRWITTDAEKAVVRKAFDVWKDVEIGLQFTEVSTRDEAEVRIGFMRGDGAWSYIGREILDFGQDERTMNFGWDLTQPGEIDTAVHEIGHTMGFPHEHQNPNAGIVWDEEAVYAALAKPPNKWSRETTYHNIIRKIDPDSIQGSSWDPDSIMHYPFEAGLIKDPEKYRKGLTPAGGLSARDKTWAKTFYPPLSPTALQELKPLQSASLALPPGGQMDFVIQPEATREYDFQTFGTSDAVMVLFEDEDGHLRYRSGEDDSGQNRNAHIRLKLIKGRKYVLRVRLYYSERANEVALMMW